MCGIWFCLGPWHYAWESPQTWIKALEGRGPEGTRIYDISGIGVMGFTRLAINGLNDAGMQPMLTDDLIWMCNGEIYNWRALATEYGIQTASGSDCEVLGPLYERFQELGLGPAAFFRALDGVFAICIYDKKRGRVVVGRDAYGVRPLYMGQRHSTALSREGDKAVWKSTLHNVAFASEIKALTPLCEVVVPFFPGTYQVLHPKTLQIQESGPWHSIPRLLNPLFSPAAG